MAKVEDEGEGGQGREREREREGEGEGVSTIVFDAHDGQHAVSSPTINHHHH